MTGAKSSETLRRVLALVSSHPAVSHLGAPSLNEATGVTSVDVTFKVNLPSEWMRCGESPSGVRMNEVVRFDFPGNFPVEPPGLSLRVDFNRNLPHMQPWMADGRPVPCIYDGDLAELLHRDGLVGIVDQTAVWLERAALGTLIYPEQGWEPVRRDSFRDLLIADADGLRRLINRNGGHKFFGFDYLKIEINGRSNIVHGQISTEPAKLNSKIIPNIFREIPLDRNPQVRFGKSLALVVWPGKYPSGESIINNTYLPETVGDINDLKKRAEMYGCTKELISSLSWLKRCLSGYQRLGPFSLAIVLLARRPLNVIGSQSPIELCPYITDIYSPDLFVDGTTTAVRPAAHLHTISRSLLVQVTGGNSTIERLPWTLVGAGSLGSKLALHLTRAGNGPEVILDKSVMMPHNAARHALIPTTGDRQIPWADAKARVLCESLRGLGHAATPLIADATSVLMSRVDARRAWSKRSWAVVNATASLVVRETLAATELMSPRVIETSLFSGGRIGLITVEGPDRNPSTTDLMAECYALLRVDPTLASMVFDNDGTMSWQNIGQGCGSLTMPMSDGRLSLFAAGISEYLLARQGDELPTDAGEILIGRLSENGIGLEWHAARISPVVVVKATMRGEVWRIRIHQRAAIKIEQESARWPQVETGGVLMGRISELSRTVHVVDVLDPPKDSIRSANEFVLGTKELRQNMETYSDTVGRSLYCLGTWHSHLSPNRPSKKDRATARAVSLARLIPSVFLISAPDGLHALLVDAADVHKGID